MISAEEMAAAIKNKAKPQKALSAEEMVSGIKNKKAPIMIEEPRESAAKMTGPGIESEIGLGERLMQGAHGFAKGVGDIADIAGQALYSAGQQGKYLKLNEKRPEPLQPKFTAGVRLPQKVSELAGKELTPGEEDTVGQFAHKAGQFLAPPYFGGPVKGAKALGKAAVKELGMASGAAGVLTFTPSITEEGTAGRAIEDFGKVLIGSNIPGKIAKTAKNAFQEKLKGNLWNSIKDEAIKAAAKPISSFSKPDPKVFKAAKEYGILLPANVGLNNPVANFLHNNVYKSIFTSSVYKKVGEKANEQMMDKIRSAIDSLGSVGVEPTAASGNFANYLRNEREASNEMVTKLYKDAEDSLRTSDRIIPIKTQEAISFSEKNLNDTPYMSNAGKKVKSIIDEAKQNLNFGKPEKNNLINNFSPETIRRNPELASEIAKKSGGEEVKRLINLRSNLMQALNYDPEVRGAKRYISGLIKAVDEDIQTVGNKEFLEKWRGANKFKKDIDIGIYQSDMANALLNGQAPREAFDNMGTVQGIREIERIGNQTPKGRELVRDLKATKARKILGEAIQGSLETGDLKHGQFAKMFSGPNEKQQEVLKELIGKEQFGKLKDVSKISESFSKAGRDLLNTSGTAPVTADFSKLEKLALVPISILTFSNPGTAALAAGAHIAAINLTSRLAANPKFVLELRRYSLERSRGNEKHAKTILERLIKMGIKEQRAIKYTAQEALEQPKEKE